MFFWNNSNKIICTEQSLMFFSGLIFYNHKTTFPEIAEIAFLENILKRVYDYSCSLPSYISLSMAVSVFLVGRGFCSVFCMLTNPLVMTN